MDSMPAICKLGIFARVTAASADKDQLRLTVTKWFWPIASWRLVDWLNSRSECGETKSKSEQYLPSKQVANVTNGINVYMCAGTSSQANPGIQIS